MPPLPQVPRPPESEAPAPEELINSRVQPAGKQSNLRIPLGWLDTPNMGNPIMNFIPMKVPLGEVFNDRISAEKRFTPGMALRKAYRLGRSVSMVLDLTRSNQYYDKEEWFPTNFGNNDMIYQKFPMQGRGAVPDPELVNSIFWLVLNVMYRSRQPGMSDPWIIVHCTHGFNRTGYLIISIVLRLTMGMRVGQAVLDFMTSRPPGIYKEEYLASLFEYYHERRPSAFGKPAQPPWKDDDEPEAAAYPDSDDEAEEPPPIAHDDVIGEAICNDEVSAMQEKIMTWVMGPAGYGKVFFPGSQPVSLARSNLGMLQARRDEYMVTWKADGTRYMLLLCHWGCYIIDRSFRIRRVQMRCPTKLHKGMKATKNQALHHFTLLDGEMVVDDHPETGIKRRRYLVYDLLVLQGTSTVKWPFQKRLSAASTEVVEARDTDRAAAHQPHFYDKEAFSIRLKGFYHMTEVEKVLALIPTLAHESDGLIFQPAQDGYKPATCEELLKWKFASMNSVDFLLKRPKAHEPLKLHLMHPSGKDKPPLMKPLDEDFVLPEGSDVSEFANRVIECTWEPDVGEKGAWKYMRHRLDKETPNAFRVYQKVMQSIEDNITAEDVVDFVKLPPNLPPQQPPQPSTVDGNVASSSDTASVPLPVEGSGGAANIAPVGAEMTTVAEQLPAET